MKNHHILSNKTSYTRYTVHGRGAKHGSVEHNMDSFSVTPPTSVQNSVIFARFTKGKSHRPLFALFSKNATFFRPKKGPRTGLSHSLTHLTAIQFSDHAKSMAQITERIFNEARSRCRSQKWIIIRTKEKEWTSVFLHYRMDRALRAKMYVYWFYWNKTPREHFLDPFGRFF